MTEEQMAGCTREQLRDVIRTLQQRAEHTEAIVKDLTENGSRNTSEWWVERQRAEAAEKALASIGEQLEHDRSLVADYLTKVKAEIAGRDWLNDEGRGSYEWDDDRYKHEFGFAVEAIKAAFAPMEKVAADWSGCPKNAAEIAKARIDLQCRVAELEQALAEARKGKGAVRTEADARRDPRPGDVLRRSRKCDSEFCHAHTVPCGHYHLTEDGQCRQCGKDCRGIY